MSRIANLFARKPTNSAQPKSFADWQRWAQSADEQSGAAAWRADDQSDLLASALMRDHIGQINHHIKANEPRDLAALLHESLYRHQGDIANPHLYHLALGGTKHVIEDYLSAVEAALQFIADSREAALPKKEKIALLTGAQKNLGQTALLLSGGASMGFFHLGVVKALLENNALPKTICGASVGSLIAGGVCARTDAELLDLFDDNLDEIYRLGLRFLKPATMWQQRSVLDQKQFALCAEENMGIQTFAEAQRHSGRNLCISVSPARARQKPRVLSPNTSPDVLIHNAVVASCAIPGMFPAVKLKAKDADGQQISYLPGESWVDGTFQGDLPMKRLGRLFNVNHFVVSQANPHAVPFLVSRHSRGPVALAADLALSSARSQTAQTLKVLQARVSNPQWHNVLEHGRLLAEQDYKGDINIHPPLSGWMYRNILSNPSIEDLKRYIRMGEQATWPMIAQIRNQMRVPMAVASALKRLQISQPK